MTDDVNLLVSPAQRDAVRQALESAGMSARGGEFIGDHDVRLRLLFAGEPEGIDWAKRIRFPEPGDGRSVKDIDGLPTVVHVRLLEMKLAIGLSNPRWPGHIGDALRLMEVHGLDKRFAARLHPLLREDFKRLVDVIRRYPGSHGPA